MLIVMIRMGNSLAPNNWSNKSIAALVDFITNKFVIKSTRKGAVEKVALNGLV